MPEALGVPRDSARWLAFESQAQARQREHAQAVMAVRAEKLERKADRPGDGQVRRPRYCLRPAVPGKSTNTEVAARAIQDYRAAMWRIRSWHSR